MPFALLSKTFDESCRFYYARRRFHLAEMRGGTLSLGTWLFAKVWLNGNYLGRTYAVSHEEDVRMQDFDLAPYLRAGNNVLGLLVHSWGKPETEIPGRFRARPVVFTCRGRIGDVSFDDLSAWKVTPAVEYSPTRRVGALLGHEERRDMRLEPVGWLKADYDDHHWVSPVIGELDGVSIKPLPLRPLREETVYPARIVKQGILVDGQGLAACPPAPDHTFWRLHFSVEHDCELRAFVPYNLKEADWPEEWSRLIYYDPSDPGPAKSRLQLDGQRPVDRFDPFLIALGYPRSNSSLMYQMIRLRLDAGVHCLSGDFYKRDFVFGFKGHERLVNPKLEWRSQPEGPFTAVTLAPDEEFSRILDDVIPSDECKLGKEGQIRLQAVDQDVSVVFEFERNMTILARIEISDASPGVELELVYSERLSDLPGLTVPAIYTDRVVLRGGPQIYETAFQYKSARILIVNIRARGGYAVIRAVAALYRHYDYDRAGEFNCPEPKLNAVWQICRNTMEFGSQDIIMDGPWREQLLYIGDNFVHNQACYHLFGNSEIVEWQHTLYAQGQMPDGIFYCNQPYRTTPDQYRLLDQVVLWPLQLEHHWLYTGREAFVRNLMPAMIRLLDGFQNRYGRAKEHDGRLRDVTGWVWVDHSGIINGRYVNVKNQGISTGMNVFYLLALQSAVRLLERFGLGEDAARFQQAADNLGEQLRQRHWDQGRQLFVDCIADGNPSAEASAQVNILAILAGLAPDPAALRKRVWDRPDVLQICNPFFFVYVFEAWHRMGRFSDILNQIRGRWGSFSDAGMTSLPEYVAYCGDWGSSIGHPWGAAPVIYLTKSIAGLYPLESGWKQTMFDPHLCDLSGLHLVVPTPMGLIRADLKKTNRGVAGELDLPPGIELVMPSPNTVQQVIIRR